eukprot:scaffold40293_cov63-Phaeocystis_antarctica.AAC.3
MALRAAAKSGDATSSMTHDDGDMATVAPSGLGARLVRHVRRVSPPLLPLRCGRSTGRYVIVLQGDV